MSEELLSHLQDGVLTLTLNRPERRNALTPALYERLLAALSEAARDPNVGAVVLTGTGAAFCSGGDVSRMAGGPAMALTMEQRIADLRGRCAISELLHGMPKPTIAMMRGGAAGAGLSLALACDMRIADASVKLSTSFVAVGLSGDFGGHYFLPRIVGPAKARELYLTSAKVNAVEALRIGLVNQVLAPEQLEEEVARIAAEMAAGPRAAIGYIKKNLNQSLHMTLPDVLDMEAIRHARCIDTDDHREAVAAFVEKRTPCFGQRKKGGAS